jgi:circadian clock protein KaiC
MKNNSSKAKLKPIKKSPTGITGFDEITGGGLPTGRPTLVCGGPGCGKTLFSIEFLVKGATQYNEPGLFMAFEENAEELTKNVAALGFDLQDLIDRKKLWIDYVHIERNEIEETGEYDLEGLFVRLNHAIDSIGAKRVVLDTLEVLFSGLPNPAILRSELRRLFRWLKDKGVTAIITGERGDGQTITRQGLDEYVSDCVVVLDHRINDQISTRRLRVVKYRGSTHGTNEYPFLIDETGLTVIPITSMGLNHEAPVDKVSSGIPKLDEMLGGQGFFRGSSILISGTAGSGKSSMAAAFVNGACQRGERDLYFTFEESQNKIVRNMNSIGYNLKPWLDNGLLQIEAARPTYHGLETHLAIIQKRIREVKPHAVVVDPVTNLASSSIALDVNPMLSRLLDFLKSRQITSLFTSLTGGGAVLEATEVGVSSLMDAWIVVRDMELNGERNRVLFLLKARGVVHSNQVREFLLTNKGISLVDVYLGDGTVLTGSARLALEARERETERQAQQEKIARQRRIEREQQALEAQIAALQAEAEAKQNELDQIGKKEKGRLFEISQDRTRMELSRRTGKNFKSQARQK